MTTLTSHIFNSDLERAEALLKNGANINEPSDGTYPIFAALNSDNPRSLEFVLKNGADANIQHGFALFEAIDYCIDGMIQNDRTEFQPESLEMVKILVDYGANLEILNSKGKTPLDALNSYSSSLNAFERLKSLFKPAIPNIDNLIKFKS